LSRYVLSFSLQGSLIFKTYYRFLDFFWSFFFNVLNSSLYYPFKEETDQVAFLFWISQDNWTAKLHWFWVFWWRFDPELSFSLIFFFVFRGEFGPKCCREAINV
jgi:hypothetical protein